MYNTENASARGHAGGGNQGHGGGHGNDGDDGCVIVRYSGSVQRGNGGTVTMANGYVYHRFNSSGTFTA